MKKGGESKISFRYSWGLRPSHSAKWCNRNLVCMECFYMVKPMVASFLFYWGLMLPLVMDVEFQNTCTVSGKRISPGLLQGIMNGHLILSTLMESH